MKTFTCSVDIDASIDRVVEIWQDQDQLVHWQEGFKSITPVSGEQGKVGAKMKMRYAMGGNGKEFDLEETILINDLPQRFKGQYQGGGMVNTMDSQFTDLGDGRTRWTSDIEYLEMNGFMMKVMATLLPGMFKKQTQKWLDRFKELVEQVPSQANMAQ